ncbi:hypothetical protein C0V70_15465 [Bacteriovorax stolpii]|uniref:Uncharacterized protein n=1 Tax=Bacteriovorax stolpii TaxID=960 RepID=A0A2K9NVF7_BACTC|nr:DUF4337 domain-containing protein [Bacteriovorax stolpii]AUN99480.1 hypothetical protein C0V70_15465 [Bacteriovorax stolpii]TDP51106.1 uncharacterized protein DUF4337 [Bacteriovorax stolpii]
MTEEVKEDHGFEIKCGVLIAIFAAIMALSDMFAGKYGEDEIKFINEKSSAYMWYQAKSIRETNVEGQRDLINTMIEGKGANDPAVVKLREHTDKLTKKIERYEKEKKEILLGSSKVGEANWVQDVDGKLGQVIGAKEYEEKIEILGRAGDQFDLSNLFFQLCLVMGAISLVVKKEKLQQIFFFVMIGLGLIGSVFSALALNIAVAA